MSERETNTRARAHTHTHTYTHTQTHTHDTYVQGHCLHALALTAPKPDERRDYVDHAIECFQRVRANVPGNPEACNALNELYLEIGERDKLLETMLVYILQEKKSVYSNSIQ